jgi:hypothetical protein
MGKSIVQEPEKRRSKSASLAPRRREEMIAFACESGTRRRTSSRSVEFRTPTFLIPASDAPDNTEAPAVR